MIDRLHCSWVPVPDEVKPITLVSRSLRDLFCESLLNLGFEEVEPDRFVKLDVDHSSRHVWEYVEDGWRETIDMLVDVNVLDDPEGLLP